jgi:ELWxxDGT repeat protein
MRPGLSALLALVLLSAVPAAALTPRLVKDINPIPAVAGSNPEGYVAAGGVAFFNAEDSLTGHELWRTDGTPAGTFQILDACSGPCNGYPRYVAHNARSYFFTVTVSEDSARELWVSGGLPANTFRLTGRLGFAEAGIWSVWVAAQSLVYFVADDGVHGLELWRTDGTRAGTFMVADALSGPSGSPLEERWHSRRYRDPHRPSLLRTFRVLRARQPSDLRGVGSCPGTGIVDLGRHGGRHQTADQPASCLRLLRS